MTQRPFITCRQLIDFIADYIDGALDEVALSDFERHLANCRSCRAYLETYRQTTRLARLLLDHHEIGDEKVEDVPEELIQTILARTAEESR